MMKQKTPKAPKTNMLKKVAATTKKAVKATAPKKAEKAAKAEKAPKEKKAYYLHKIERLVQKRDNAIRKIGVYQGIVKSL